MPRGGKRANAGRPPTEVDIDAIEQLASIGGTLEEIAAVFGVSKTTLKDRADISEAIERGREGGRATLRRLQWQGAESGNATMLIWLGKQMLGQRDKQDHQHDGDLTITVSTGVPRAGSDGI